MKKLQYALLFGLIFTVVFSFLSFEVKCREIRENVLRLHILANSDSGEDQALKLKVRDRLLSESEGLFENISSEKAAAESARGALPQLTEAARDEIAKNGYDYDVTLEVAMTDFETRTYGEVTLPAGEYEAVRVLIGDAEGQNWWCVMFPSMCLPAARESKELEEVLSEDGLDIVENAPKYEFRLKSVELFEKMKRRVAGWIK